MAAVTYPHEAVAILLNEEVIPLQLLHNAEPYATDYNVKWTPSFFMLDSDGKTHASSVGYLPPEEFIPFIHLGMAKAYFDEERFPEALDRLETVLAEFPQCQFAPEAIYLRGVTRYKMTQAPDGLVEAYERLKADYPGSEWARKAEPYALLKKTAA
jgi:TolA-binding protein